MSPANAPFITAKMIGSYNTGTIIAIFTLIVSFFHDNFLSYISSFKKLFYPCRFSLIFSPYGLSYIFIIILMIFYFIKMNCSRLD